MLRKIFAGSLLFILIAGASMAQGDFIFGDPLPNAPELSARGEYAVGVQTRTLVKEDAVDLLNAGIYDREITVEVWYPADADMDAVIEYDENLGRADQDNLEPFTFKGRATRDAAVDNSGAPYPLIIVSHGYPGSRLMMTYLTENLASKGYVVVAIGHTESTFTDVADFGSTLFNRSTDQEFVLDQMSQLAEDDETLGGLLDADNTALIGYSMGGYGALNTIGAGYNEILGGFLGEVINPRLAANPDYAESLDDRFKAAVLFAPWGGDLTAVGLPGAGMWNLEDMAGIDIPTLWVSGSQDDVSMYDGIVRLFDNSVNSDRYLLTYDNALHNSAPNPPPPEATELGQYERYADPVWDERRINNVNQHFITAFLSTYIGGDDDAAEYLNLDVENGNDAVFAVGEDGEFTEDHTYWAGFPARSALGLSLRHETPSE